jgi:hypothetical protein
MAHSRAHAGAGRVWPVCYHFLLFIALRHAPPVEANLVNYLWPLFIVVLAPVVLPGVALRLPMCWRPCWALAARPLPSWAGAN